MPPTTALPTPSELRTRGRSRPAPPPQAEEVKLHIVPWVDPVADPHGVTPCSRYVELFWLPTIGPSTTWLLRRLSYGLEVRRDGFDLELSEAARSLGLGSRMGKNSPFRRALQRLCTFELARGHGPGGLAVRTVVPPLPLRHLSRLPASLQSSHRRWAGEQRLPEAERMRRRAGRLARELSGEGRSREDIERQLGAWHFHPAVAFRAAEDVGARATPGAAEGSGQPGSSSCPAGVSPQ